VVQGQPGHKVHKTPSQAIAGFGFVYLLSQATEEAESRKIWFSGQPRYKSLQDPHLNRKELGMVGHVRQPSLQGKFKIGL
jgi:hypothetical protein